MASRRKKEPIHKIFYICSTYTPDAAWSEFLKECSFGKFPKGVKFEDNAIKCTRKKQTFTEYIPKDAEKALEVIIQIFRDRLGIKTSRENKSASAKFNRRRAETRIQSWKDATTISARNSLIRHYVDRFSSVYFLTMKERNELLSLLELSIATKILGSDRIKVEDGKIIEIDGLMFNTFTRNISLRGRVNHPAPVLTTVPLDFKPVIQTNYPDQYFTLLDYHCTKMRKAQT